VDDCRELQQPNVVLHTADSSRIMQFEYEFLIEPVQISDTFRYADYSTEVPAMSFLLTDYRLLMFNTCTQLFAEAYKHASPVVTMAPNLSETRFVLNPINVLILDVTDLTQVDVMFDIADRSVFSLIGSRTASPYHFTELVQVMPSHNAIETNALIRRLADVAL
jgi:hypothetical protein